MLIILTPQAETFASTHEGRDALIAKVEREAEELNALDAQEDQPWSIHLFSWHGNDNMSMNRLKKVIIVDCVDDDDDTIQLTPESPGGDSPSVSALSKERDDG